jgi:hypothetical protein
VGGWPLSASSYSTGRVPKEIVAHRMYCCCIGRGRNVQENMEKYSLFSQGFVEKDII